LRTDRPIAGAAAGFTLIEMIIVLAVLGLVAGIVISRGPSHSATVDMRSAATRLLQGMRATRAKAIASAQAQLFTVQSAQHSYRVGNEAPQMLPRLVTLGLDVAGKPARGIAFLPDGSSSGGTVTLQSAGRKMAVTVNWLSGRMQIAQSTP
jgi:general secretion pathway protein H